MIQSFHDRMTEDVFRGRCPKGFPADLFKAARRRLIALDGATALDDLKIPTSNRLHPLTADRAGQHAIAVKRSVPDLLRLDGRRTGARRVHGLPLREASMSDIITLDALRRSFDDTESVTVLPPLHPGEVLREEFMVPLGLTAGAVAKALNLPRSRIERIVKEEIGISTDTALRLGRYFRTSHLFWLNLQTRFESETLLSEIGAELEGIQPVPEAA